MSPGFSIVMYDGFLRTEFMPMDNYQQNIGSSNQIGITAMGFMFAKV
jgi:hypothetical protein